MSLVIEKTARILELVSRNEPCTLTEMVGYSGMKKPTLFLLMKSMVKVRMLEKDNDNRYSLGPGLFELTAVRGAARFVTNAADRAARMLCERSGESVIISTVEDMGYKTLSMINSARLVKVDNALLPEKSFYRNATGRMLLSRLPEAAALKILELKGMPAPGEWPEVKTKEDFLSELRRLAALEIFEKESDEAVFIAAAFADRSGVPFAAGVNVPAARCAGPHKKETLASLAETVEILKQELSQIKTRSK
jgi:DNA-binding IclR family transcriptional regulator